jgi:hypothetical protein
MSAAPSWSVETPHFLILNLLFYSVVFTGFRAHCDGAALTRRRSRNAQNLGDTILNTPLPTFPEMQNALNDEQARLRGLVARRRDGLFFDWSSIINVYRRTGKKRQQAILACCLFSF